MNRRGFLSLFAIGSAAIVAGHELDLEKLLWLPGQKSFFLPPEKGPLVTGAAAESAFEQVQAQPLEHALRGLGQTVYTSIGMCVLDNAGVLVSVNGRIVTYVEAAQIQINHYQRQCRPSRNDPRVLALAVELQARRELSR